MTRFWRWYDSLHEPRRLLTALLLFLPACYLLASAFPIPFGVRAGSAIYLVILVLSRGHYMRKKPSVADVSAAEARRAWEEFQVLLQAGDWSKVLAWQEAERQRILRYVAKYRSGGIIG